MHWQPALAEFGLQNQRRGCYTAKNYKEVLNLCYKAEVCLGPVWRDSTESTFHFFCPCFSYADRSQDSTAVVLSDSNSTQDMFTEPASSQDSAKKTFPETRPYSSCLEAAAPGKENLGPLEEKGMWFAECYPTPPVCV